MSRWWSGSVAFLLNISKFSYVIMTYAVKEKEINKLVENWDNFLVGLCTAVGWYRFTNVGLQKKTVLYSSLYRSGFLSALNHFIDK